MVPMEVQQYFHWKEQLKYPKQNIRADLSGIYEAVNPDLDQPMPDVLYTLTRGDCRFQLL